MEERHPGQDPEADRPAEERAQACTARREAMAKHDEETDEEDHRLIHDAEERAKAFNEQLRKGGFGEHRTHSGFTALVGKQRPHQRLAVDPVGLRPAAARGCDGGRIDNVALDSFALEDPMDPEPIETGFLDRHDPKAATSTGLRSTL